MVKILVVEDEPDLNKSLSVFLKNSGFLVESAFDGEQALDKYEENKPDLILTDIMMPKMDGFMMAKEIRSFDEETPIVFMTARVDKSSHEKGYSIGIDDYIEKPFDLDILKMKIDAILRRSKISTKKVIELGNFKMNEEERIATISGKEVPLSAREFDILFKLVCNPKKIFTRSALMDEFWDYDTSTTSRTVDVYMAKLRNKTEACDKFSIETVHGLGYKVVIKNE